MVVRDLREHVFGNFASTPKIEYANLRNHLEIVRKTAVRRCTI